MVEPSEKGVNLSSNSSSDSYPSLVSPTRELGLEMTLLKSELLMATSMYPPGACRVRLPLPMAVLMTSYTVLPPPTGVTPAGTVFSTMR